MIKYVFLFLASLGLSLLLTPLVRFGSKQLRVMDMPGGRKIHTRPIPRLGGFSIFIAFHLVLLASSQFSFFHLPPGFLKKINFWWIFLASAIIFGLGAIDDFRRMPAAVKFLFQIMAGLIVTQTCSRIEVISLPFGTFNLGAFAVPATVFWVVAITNAVNLLDGLDGLAAGTSFIVCIAIFGVSLLSQNIGIALVSAILAGSILGFLRYNFHPASIFLGDSGSYFLGFIISFLSIMSGQKGTTTLGIPCFTIRENTERPVTIEEGSNTLVGTTAKGILTAFDKFRKGETKKGRIPELWDSHASERIVDILLGSK